MSLIDHNAETIEIDINKICLKLNQVIFNFNNYLQTHNVLDQTNLALQLFIQILDDPETVVAFTRTNVIKVHEMWLTVEKLLEQYSKVQLLFLLV